MKYSDEKHNFIVKGYEPIRRDFKNTSWKELYVILEPLKTQGYRDIEVTESDNIIERR